MDFAEVPPRVEYYLTDRGERFRPILQAMWDWSEAEFEFTPAEKAQMTAYREKLARLAAERERERDERASLVFCCHVLAIAGEFDLGMATIRRGRRGHDKTRLSQLRSQLPTLFRIPPLCPPYGV